VVNYRQDERKATCLAKKQQQQQAREQVPQRGFKEAQVLAVVIKTKGEKLTSTKQKQEALVSDNKESDDKE